MFNYKEDFQKFKNEKPFFAKEQVNSSYRKFLSGSDLQRYKINWSGQFLSYGKHLAAPRNASIFEGIRILIARIPVKSRYTFRATLTEDNFVHEQSIEVITDLIGNPKFLIGVLNSKVVSYYAIHRFDFLQRSTFPQMRLTQIKDFPIPDATDSQQEDIAQVVEQLMEEMKKDSPDTEKVNQLNLEIDELVMDLFDLAEEEKQTVRDFEV